MKASTHTPRATRGRGPIPHAVEAPPASAGGDRQTALLPRALDAFAVHVKARDAVRAAPTRARAAKAEAAFQDMVDCADAIASAPAPRTIEGLRALAVAIAMANEGCLDDGDDVHAALRALLTGVITATGATMPAGFESL